MSEKVYVDFSGKQISKIKSEVREMLTKDLIEWLAAKYDTVEQVGNSEIAVIVGAVDNEPVVATIKPVVKSWYDKKKTDDNGRDVVQYDIFQEAKDYKDEISSKKKKKEKNTAVENT